MAGYFTRGIILEQHKEPALSLDLHTFLNVNMSNATFEGGPYPPPEEMTPEQIVEVARLANITDERDGVPLHEKLALAHDAGIRTIVGDASDDEPYISSQLNPLLKKQAEALLGMKLAQKTVGASKAFFSVYKNITDVDIQIPGKIGDVAIRRVRGRYPAEFRLLDAFPHDRPVLLIGVCALIHLARAASRQRIQTSSFVTIAGNCITNPMNMEVSLGITVAQLLDRCGLSLAPTSIVLGGPMTGISCMDPDSTVITRSTRAVLAFHEDEKNRHYQCIGCGRCVEVCPENLTPFYLNHCIEHGQMSQLRFYEIERCVGCGTCSYICPAKQDIAAHIKQARKQLPPLPPEKGVKQPIAAQEL